jgi:hypothetical protein
MLPGNMAECVREIGGPNVDQMPQIPEPEAQRPGVGSPVRFAARRNRAVRQSCGAVGVE